METLKSSDEFGNKIYGKLIKDFPQLHPDYVLTTKPGKFNSGSKEFTHGRVVSDIGKFTKTKRKNKKNSLRNSQKIKQSPDEKRMPNMKNMSKSPNQF